jgi:tripartite-type tricarboxylate transporter receptor subunit TctC
MRTPAPIPTEDHPARPSRRQLLQAATLPALGGLVPWLPGALPQARAQAGPGGYPARPVRWIIPTSPGAGTDVSARLFAQIASDTWKQSVVPDNRSGASGMLGLDALAGAAPDGYTLSFMSVSQFIDATLLQKYAFEATKDFTPISLLAATPLILLAHPDANVSTLAQMVARARAEPRALNYASGGSGGLTHLAMEVLLKGAGAEVTHIPYKGSGPAVIDLLAGRVQFAYSTPPAVVKHIQASKLKALAVTSATRFPGLPDVPTVGELGFPAAAITTWYGLFGPAHLPADIVAFVARTLTAASRAGNTKDRIESTGVDPVLMSPPEFAQMLRRERENIIAAAKAIGFKKEG